MIKRMSVFFARPVRERMESDRDFGASPGLTAAVDFTNSLLKASFRRFMSDAEAQAIGGGAWKYFDGSHCESKEVARSFHEAQRAVGFIFFVSDDVIALELSFYATGQKRSFHVITLWFNQDTGEVCALSSSGASQFYQAYKD